MQLFAFNAVASGLANRAFGREFGFLEITEDGFGAFDDGFRDAGEAGDLDAVALIRPAFDDFSEEDDLVVPFADSDIEVADAGEAGGEFGEFVIMGGEQRFCTDLIM